MRARPRLRNRIAIRVGLLVAVVSIAVGTATYLVVRDTLVDEREHGAAEQFATNAIVLGSAMRTSEADEVALLAALRPQERARELLLADDRWYSASIQIQPDDLPPTLVGAVRSGSPSMQRFASSEGLLLGLGAPIADGAFYFEVFALRDLEVTLAALRNTLWLVGAAATIAGILTGRWIGGHVTRPLEDVSAAAVRISGGDLDTRLDGSSDRDLAQIASSFNQMADSLQQRIAREAQFSADVSHELRSPLTTIVNAVAVLDHRRRELSAQGQEALDLLVADINRFERLVSNLIEIAKHDAGTSQWQAELMTIDDAVRAVMHRHRDESVLVTVADDAAGVLVRIDRLRFERAMVNVLDNAMAYAGGATEVSVSASPTAVRVAVVDAGPGVADVDRERIFERFARGGHASSSGQADGSGLGLALTRENLRTAGGGIWVEDSDNGRGSRFVLELPKADS